VTKESAEEWIAAIVVVYRGWLWAACKRREQFAIWPLRTNDVRLLKCVVRRWNWRQIFPEKKMALIFQITLWDTISESKGDVHLLHKKKSTDEVEKTKRKQRNPKTSNRRIRSKTKQRDAKESFLIVFL
jgi:hypothetical protein